MSATDELRRMLDERGISYETDENERYAYTLWGNRWPLPVLFSEPLAAKSGTFGAECELRISPVTPAQAIAATMPDEASTHKALIRESDARMALQCDYNNQIVRIRNQRKQLREMQAALERKTCHMVLRHDYTVYGEAPDIWWECDGCGCTLPNPLDMSEIHYCPSCGREVVG